MQQQLLLVAGARPATACGNVLAAARAASGPRPSSRSSLARPGCASSCLAQRLVVALAVDGGTGRPRRGALLSRSTAAKISGLSVIDSSAPARIRSRPSGGSRPSEMPSPARMNENSPICARLADDRQAGAERIAQQHDDAEGDQRLADDDQRQHAPAPSAARGRGSSDRTACRPRRRTARRRHPAAAANSAAALWLRSEFARAPRRRRTRRARRRRRTAPPSRRRCRARCASTDSVNSSREPVRATWRQQPGHDARTEQHRNARRTPRPWRA